MVRNEHVYPHTTSYENRVEEMDVMGVSEGPRNDVRGIGERPGEVRGARDRMDQEIRGDRYPYERGRFGGETMKCGCRGRCHCRRRRRGFWW